MKLIIINTGSNAGGAAPAKFLITRCFLVEFPH